MNYIQDRCKSCKKLRGHDIYFCSGCGEGEIEKENVWEEVILTDTEGVSEAISRTLSN